MSDRDPIVRALPATYSIGFQLHAVLVDSSQSQYHCKVFGVETIYGDVRVSECTNTRQNMTRIRLQLYELKSIDQSSVVSRQ